MSDVHTQRPARGSVAHLTDFQVIELRRYTIQPGERDHFALYFESYFPEAFEQLGSLIYGHFLERDNPAGFTWIRGFHDLEAQATADAAFYGGPLWREHGPTMNDRLIDHTNVLLLRPLHPERGLLVLPAVDPVYERQGSQGVVVAHLFAVKAESATSFARQAEEACAMYRTAGAREAGVLVTLDEANRYPSLPVRTDGPFFVWLGIVQDNQAVAERVLPLAEQISQSLARTGQLRAVPEIIVLDPTSRSRMRWLVEE
jgi:hypothetical protein